MSVCTSCIKPKAIARCITNLVIGSVSSLSTAVYVYVKNVTLDSRTVRYAVTSSAAGLVTIPITPQRFSEDHSYEVHITLTNSSNINVKETISIGGQEADCVQLRFENILTNENVPATYTTQTLSV